jgi:hypothetical protein
LCASDRLAWASRACATAVVVIACKLLQRGGILLLLQRERQRGVRVHFED